MNWGKIIPFLIAGILCLYSFHPAIVSAQQAKKPFTLADEIGLTLFSDQIVQPAVQLSPDGTYFAVFGERGRQDLNLVEDSLRFYRSQDVETFLKRPNQAEPPSPVWIVTRSRREAENGILSDWRWLADSRGVAYLEHTDGGNQRLVLADLRKKVVEPLTSSQERVEAFDIRDGQNYVYTVAVSRQRERWEAERKAPAIVGTGRTIYQLLFPGTSLDKLESDHSQSELWAVAGGKRFQVKHDGMPLIVTRDMSLSPDKCSVVAVSPVPQVPSSWEKLYPPSYASAPGIHAGDNSAHQYVRIDLQKGSVQSLTDAPVSWDAAYWAVVFSGPRWSADGLGILLPSTFLKSKNDSPSRPCVAVVDRLSNTAACVEMLKGETGTETGFEEGFHHIKDADFVRGDRSRVRVISLAHDLSVSGTTEYQSTGGAWQVAGHSEGEDAARHGDLEVHIRQSFKDPPQLIAMDKQASRVLWDPNPQLKNLELGEARLYQWKNKEGKETEGGLFMPVGYKPGVRYPLVIQTHGFVKSEYRPSGLFTTAFAARELAAAGIMVLQADTRCPVAVPQEGPCVASTYESAATQLVSEGLVDPDKIGIIGFSRTCFYVMEALTITPFHFKAASITDGILVNYVGHILNPDRNGPEDDAMIGAPPFGEGLQQWLKRSPDFNLDKVQTPLLVVGAGRYLIDMWEPYSALRHLRKPVDLIMLNTDEHVLTNPAVRMASQGSSVDWFRFWLQDYEDPGPAKAGQYKRWRDLRKLQAENEKERAPTSARRGPA